MGGLATFGIHFLETLFFAGLLGSVAVVLYSLVGDIQDLVLRKNDPV